MPVKVRQNLLSNCDIKMAQEFINNIEKTSSSVEKPIGLKLKVCGMKYSDNITEVAALQPDYMGFIFYKKSARFFEGIMPEIASEIKKVGVFVNASIEAISEKINTYHLDVIQLHGDETAEFCLKLKEHHKPIQKLNPNRKSTSDGENAIKLIKVFSVDNQFDFEQLKPFEEACDYFLFDTKGAHPGGNGFTFNWNVLKEYPSIKPYFLSGGIGIEELDALKQFLANKESQYCCAIDINSKFEIEAGLKNLELLKTFKTNLSSYTSKS